MIFSWLLQRKLQRLGRRVRLDRDFEAAMRKKLEVAGSVSASSTKFIHWKTGFASLGTILCLMTSTGAYAYSADSVVPEHALYPVRTLVERAEVRLAQASGRQELVQWKLLRRRVQETARLQMMNRSVPAAHLQALLNATAVQVENGELADEERFAAEDVQLEGRELSEMVEQQELTDAEEDRVEIKKQILEQTARLDKKIERLKNERARSLKSQSVFKRQIQRRLK